MDLQIKWLKDFLQLSQSLSFSDAANMRHVSQPAFSRRIQSLENHLNCKLVNRLSSPIKLTAQGELFAQTCQQVLTNLEQGVSQINPALADKQQVKFAATHTLATGVFPALLEHINQFSNNISCKLHIADADDCVDLLNSQQCDYLLAFTDPLLNKYQHDSLLLAQVKLLPVCKVDKQGQPLYHLDQKQTEAIPYLAYQQNIFLGRSVAQVIKQNRQQEKLVKNIESSMADGLKMMALKGLGVAWIPEFSLQNEIDNQQLIVCGDEHWHSQLEVRLYRKQQTTPAFNSLWNSLAKVKL